MFRTAVCLCSLQWLPLLRLEWCWSERWPWSVGAAVPGPPWAPHRGQPLWRLRYRNPACLKCRRVIIVYDQQGNHCQEIKIWQDRWNTSQVHITTAESHNALRHQQQMGLLTHCPLADALKYFTKSNFKCWNTLGYLGQYICMCRGLILWKSGPWSVLAYKYMQRMETAKQPRPWSSLGRWISFIYYGGCVFTLVNNLGTCVMKFGFIIFDLGGHGQSPPKTIEILTKLFCISGSNLVILAWTGWWVIVQTSLWLTHTHGQIHRRTHIGRQWQYPKAKTGLR